MARLQERLLPVALFAVVLGLKFDVIHRFGSDLPMWDQWDAEGLHLFVPAAENRLGAGDFIRPHNEHRIALTKLLGWLELSLNGQWDARLQCAVNAVLHSAFAVIAFLFGRRILERRFQPGLFIVSGALFGPPLAWQNVISGFHSQQYFLLLLSFGAITLLPFADPWKPRWFVGAVCAALALFTMASGFFAAAIVIAVIAARRLLEPAAEFPPRLPAVLLAGAVVVAGVLLHVEVSYHDNLKARSVSDFALYLVHSLQWPSPDHEWLAVIAWLPVAALAVALLRARRAGKPDLGALAVFGLGAWVLLQIAASAYARGADAGLPASRYIDTLAFGMFVNALALGWLLNRSSGTARAVWMGFAVVWLINLGFGTAAQLRPIYTHELPTTENYLRNCERNVRNYLLTDRPQHLFAGDIPYPSAKSLIERIDIESLRAILPQSVRPPEKLEPARISEAFRVIEPPAKRRRSDPAATDSVEQWDGPAEFRRYWSARDGRVGEWVAGGLYLKSPAFLRVSVRGNMTASSNRLEVRNARTQATVAEILPVESDSGNWREVLVSVPGGELEMYARSDSGGTGFDFAEPIAVSRLSHWSSRWLATGRSLIWIGGLMGVGVIVAQFAASRLKSPASAATPA